MRKTPRWAARGQRGTLRWYGRGLGSGQKVAKNSRITVNYAL
jgi:hypothetical protein